MAAVKHWFADLANTRVCIFVDNQVCMALLNHGITRSPFLAACIREIQYFLANFNIELRAKYITSKNNHLEDTCSRAFSSDIHYKSFNKLLNDGVLKLDNLFYDKFYFDKDW